MTDGALVVGYGNPLRTDDGVGWHVAERLADDPRLEGVTVLRRHQLTPELALDISVATRVVLVDARRGVAAGTFTAARVERAEGSATTWSHHLGPPSLIALAHELYGRVPDVFLVSCGVNSLEIGDKLSLEVEAALPRVVDAVAELIVPRAAEAVADHVSERGDA
jgi:hydrogenase maturation protease